MKLIFKLLFVVVPWIIMFVFKMPKAGNGNKKPLADKKKNKIIDGEIVK